MDTVWTILKILAVVAFFSLPIYKFIIIKQMERKRKNIPGMTSEDLRVLAFKQPFLHCNDVIKELKSRNEDISFALPLLLKLAVNRNPLVQTMGWAGLKQYFTDQLSNIDFTKDRPNSEERKWIESFLIQIEKQSSEGH
jgi:hypothetical protein